MPSLSRSFFMPFSGNSIPPARRALSAQRRLHVRTECSARSTRILASRRAVSNKLTSKPRNYTSTTHSPRPSHLAASSKQILPVQRRPRRFRRLRTTRPNQCIREKTLQNVKITLLDLETKAEGMEPKSQSVHLCRRAFCERIIVG